ncbi:MAG: Na(+)/H(+) antiporter subunit D [Hydrogenophaga sp.]|uniref:Na(+)/H(+) antiporter subunit D n=1 Tax=Hydrogenophaga sp. TaxID=1904254 RepID=UPI0027555EA8|nr:Na(+)/H(+) antiporter subunit D [Hydrogenophaga sp.]MDP2416040.1 Na(+)/H(+) antiporter subunit D [Hydrogenophaga sp.]MDZ4189953.1 Na(+)/H(+) antiporter subunit D [Hydrogenophaga sp.]
MTETTLSAGGFWLHPSVLLIIGALLLPLFKGVAQQAYRVALAALFVFVVFRIELGSHAQFAFGGLDLVAGRADKLSLAFAYVFAIITMVATIYSLHVRDNIQHVAGLFYAAAAVGVVLAGDLITLYVFWELMMLASVWLIWRRATAQAYAAGYRYLMVHAVSGVMLLGGIVLYYGQTGSVAFEQMQVGSWASYLILIGFLVNAAVPPLHAWLTDAYPEATITGAIFLSALTTKTAVYTLIRGYPGTEFLVYLGTVMALWGVVYAVLANDIRRLLAYHIISQVGYMVAGVGMGTAIALNGATAHAFTHILYKSVLFMGAGAVIAMTGKSKLSELGGIYKYMPITFVLYMVGAFSISAFPLFSGFVSKTMVVEAAAVDHRAWIWLLLSMASAGTFLHTGLKLPYFTFLGKDVGLRPKEAPWNMLLAMGISAFFCVFIGVNPAWLYQFMPFPVNYNAYSAGHLFWELQLLLFTGLGFFLMLKHLGGEAKLSVDTDWIYRKAGPVVVKAASALVRNTWRGLMAVMQGLLNGLWDGLKRLGSADGVLGRSWGIGQTTLWTVVIVSLYGLVYLTR